MQVLCPPAPQGCELQKEEVRTHEPAAREEEDQVEQQRHAQHAGPAVAAVSIAVQLIQDIIMQRLAGSSADIFEAQ